MEEEEEILDFDENEWQEEMIKKQKEKLAKYEKSLTLIIGLAFEKGTVTLQEIKKLVEAGEVMQSVLIPSVDIFKEIMVELIKSKEINLVALQKEKSEYIVEETLDFQLNDMILNVVSNDEKRRES